MLTIPVNIAVFAAFWPRVGGVLRSTAAFKPVCAIWQLDVSRYGWQKRQRSGKKRQEVARWAAKTATLDRIATPIHGNNHVVAHGCGWRCLARYAVGKVPAA